MSVFEPEWSSPPGTTIVDVMTHKGITSQQLSEQLCLNDLGINQLFEGKLDLTHDIARKLSACIGGSESFWLNREKQYRSDLKRAELLEHETTSWLQTLPTKDMVKFRWISPSTTPNEKRSKCLDFFGVCNIREWYEKFENFHLIASYRTSNTFDSEPLSVMTWLQQGIIESEKVACTPWNPNSFEQALIQVRQFTRIKEPSSFVPKIRALFARSGVALVIVPTPSKCRASGATFFTSEDKAILLLSFRYLSDDHFWFSLFHEAGHILLHGKNSTFIENLDEVADQRETEANEFSQKILIPEEYQDEFLALNARQWKNIVRFAKKIGVSSGIVVGQMQHFGLLGHHQLNKLKTRFKWIESEISQKS